MDRDLSKQTWLTEPEAAEYCRCSLWSFRRMRLPAKDAGGRKVYKRETLDMAIEARDWDRRPRTEFEWPANLQSVRIRPYKPRKPSLK